MISNPWESFLCNKIKTGKETTWCYLIQSKITLSKNVVHRIVIYGITRMALQGYGITRI